MAELLKVCKVCNGSFPVSMFSKNKTYKDGLMSKCKPCAVADTARWQAANPEKTATYKRNHASRNVEHERERARIKSAKFRRENKELSKARYAEWASRNKGILRSYVAKRRAAMSMATPPWANQKEIADIYQTATDWNQLFFDDPVHVDHVVPLNSKIVQGLHVPANLRIIRASENIRKSNTTWPDMP